MSDNQDIDSIILKNNIVAGVVPAPSELTLGEIAINTADGIIYTKKNDGSVVAVGVSDSGSSLVQTVAGRIGNVIITKSDVELNNVDNTSDANKPVSIAQAAADTAIQNIASQDATTKSDAAKAYSIQRGNHTGTQSSSTISDFSSAVSTASPVKSVAGKTGIVALTKQDVGLNNVDNTSDSNKPVSTAQASADTAVLVAAETLATEKSSNAQLYAVQRSNHTGTQAISTVNGLQTALNNKADSVHNHDDRYYTETEINTFLSEKQASGNYATLVGGLVPASQLPSYVDDVLEYVNLAAFPTTGETGKIYVAQDNNKTYRWAGSFYVEISASPGSTDSVPEGATNLYYTDARVQLAAPVKSVAGRTGIIDLTKADVGLGSIDNTSDLDKPISVSVQTALNTKSDSGHQHNDVIKFNTGIGADSSLSTSTGTRNTSTGHASFSINTTGSNNSAFGSPSLWQNLTGSNNTATGAWSMIFNDSGSDNTGIGTGALSNNVNASRNTALGSAALFNTTTGLDNIGIGAFSAIGNITGSNNIVIGTNADVSDSVFNNCLVIGNNAVANRSGQFVLGSSTNPLNTSLTVGATGTATALPGQPLGYLQVRLNNNLVKIPYYRE
jgi:hypothetical protein